MVTDSEALYHELLALVADMPDLYDETNLTLEVREWLGRAAARIEAAGDILDAVNFKFACDHLDRDLSRSQHVETIMSILYRAMARAEMAAPVSSQGTFIPAGGSFDAHSAVSKILRVAKVNVLMIDPFADENILSEFAVLAHEGVSIQILADNASKKPALKPAAERWVKQYGVSRPLEVRLADPKSLHDRLIIVDSQETWALGQSFNALATRAPTSILKADTETAKLKIDAYTSIWNQASKLVKA